MRSAGKRGWGANALWKPLSGSECAVETAVGERMRCGRRCRKCSVEVYGDFCNLRFGLRPGGCKRCGWSRKSGGLYK